jgi:peptidoglycan-N-acetylglucosamine deacetylase
MQSVSLGIRSAVNALTMTLTEPIDGDDMSSFANEFAGGQLTPGQRSRRSSGTSGREPQRRAAFQRALITGAALLAVEYVPACASLVQWTSLEELPGGLARWQGPRGEPQVALTFDDGPHPDATPAILDRLEELDLKGSFFPLASLVEKDGTMVKEVLRRGHVVGTHGYLHQHHLLHGPRWVQRDLDAADAVMRSLGVPVTWFRPPYGQSTAATFVTAWAKGWRPMFWSIQAREWTTDNSAEVARRIVRRLRPGSVVLLHDNDMFGSPGMWRRVLAAMGPVADELHRRGLRAVTLDELVSAHSDAQVATPPADDT